LPVFAIAAAPVVCAQGIIHVDADAPGPVHDGATWDTALTDLQDALAIAVVGTEIRVAAGTYKPDGGSGDRAATFRLPVGVILRGSYAGFGEIEPDARNLAVYPAILSGDLASDDGANFANYDENSYHVMSVEGTDGVRVLDGFTITGGNADGQDDAGIGGGLHCDGCGLTLMDCTIQASKATEGGGAYLSNGSDATWVRCTVAYNWAVVHGGGIYNGAATIALEECTFHGNRSSGDINSRGGALYVDGGTSTLTDCQFLDNNFARYGAAVFVDGAAAITVLGCTLRDNMAQQIGGGIYSLSSGSEVTIRDTVFDGNRAGANSGAMHLGGNSTYLVTDSTFVGNQGGAGGAMLIAGFASTTINRCLFLGNTSDQGGAIYTRARDALTANSVFSGNAAETGGAIYDPGYPGSSNMKLRNCSFAGNTAVNGRAIATASGPFEFSAVNCIFWDDGPDEVSLDGYGALSITNSTVRGGWIGEGNSNESPIFEDADGADGVVGTPDDDLRLQPASPCVNAGDSDAVADAGETDLDGHARVLCGVVDLGAYEFGIGDYNCDRLVDLTDLSSWEACMTGPDIEPYLDGCEPFDFEYDGDVDLHDFARFTRQFTGPQ
jgi:predicted outer membrane repeat protein